jgi:hypothetical protein
MNGESSNCFTVRYTAGAGAATRAGPGNPGGSGLNAVDEAFR